MTTAARPCCPTPISTVPPSRPCPAPSDRRGRRGGARIGQLGVLSSVRGEGRTSIAAAMAYVQAHDYGRSTLLLDADFDGPRLASLYGLERSPGAAEVVASRAGIEEATHRVDDG